MYGKGYMIDALTAISRDIIEHEEELNHLDNAIGDGDHGTNMARFARVVLQDLPEIAAMEHMGEILQHVGMRRITEIGGSAGPLFGKFYLQSGMIDIPSEESFDILDSKSAKFRKLHSTI